MNFRTTSMRFAQSAVMACSLAFAAGAASAADWPTKPLRIVVPFAAGGSTDTAARLVAQGLSDRLGQPVVVENKSGASGSIGAAYVSKADPDGYTLLVATIPPLLAPHMYKSAGYDSVKDFSPVAAMYDLPMVLVSNPDKLPEITDLQQLIALAKENPDKLDYTSAGTGSFGHLTMELLKQLGDFNIQHISYRGAAPAVTDLLGGQVPLMYADLMSVQQYVQADKLRILAVSSSERLEDLPEVKTTAEQGFEGFNAVAWASLLAPAGTPQDIVARISNDVRGILATKEIQEKLRAAGSIVHYQDPAETSERLREDYTKWGKVIRDNGISND